MNKGRAMEVLTSKFYGQATKGVRWMPRHFEAMKDVVSCEKLRWDALNLWSADVRMGEPNNLERGANRGKWTISVPRGKENKSVIPSVAASERGTA